MFILIRRFISGIDFFPTLLELVGIATPGATPPRLVVRTVSGPVDAWPPAALDGVSLVPLFDGKLAKRGRPIGFESKGQTAWIGDRYKLYSNGKAKGAPKLFDLIADPSENQDLAKREPGLAKHLARELAAWRDSCRASAAGRDY